MPAAGVTGDGLGWWGGWIWMDGWRWMCWDVLVVGKGKLHLSDCNCEHIIRRRQLDIGRVIDAITFTQVDISTSTETIISFGQTPKSHRCLSLIVDDDNLPDKRAELHLLPQQYHFSVWCCWLDSLWQSKGIEKTLSDY